MPIGSLFAFLLTEEPYVAIGGLFVVLLRASSAGLLVVGGGGGGGRFPAGAGIWGLKPFCCFKAAMRADTEVNWGSSTSAMVVRR